MAGYGGESGTGGVAGGGGGSPSLDVRRMRTNQNQPFSQQIGDGAISSGGKQLLNLTQRVDSSDIALFSADEDKGKSVLPAARNLRFNNQGDSALGVSLKLNHWSSGTAEDAEDHKYIHFIVGRGESLNMPITRMIASDNSAIDAGTAVANTAPDSNMYTDSGADVDTATDGAIASGTTTTPLYLEDGHSKYFRVGDLIRLENEICEVTAVGTGADLASSTCTIIRAVHGSTAATHADDVAVSFPFFNAYHDFDKFSTARTDNDGKFKAFNAFGYGRATDAPTSGILPGSVAIKCYNSGYQQWGMSGVTPGTNTGLAVSTTYQFNITVDGGSTFVDLSFTTDASNVNFGGRNGVLGKIQDALDTQYYTAGNLFTKKVTVGIVNGDVRFTSGSYLSSSAILLAAPGSGTTPFGVGRIPAIANINSAVAARVPDDTITDNTTGETMSNTAGFMYDDGRGRLVGNGSGIINYDTGAIDFVSKPNAEFVVSLVHTSALSGKVTETTKNTIEEIKVRSMNAKVTGKINLVVEG